MTGTTVSVDATVAAVFREEAGRLTGSLTRALGNFDVAEESVQDALLTALERWPREGIPQRPGAWLATVARNRAVDLHGELDERLTQVLMVCCTCCSTRGIWQAAAPGRRAATWPRTPPGWRPSSPPCTRGSQRCSACWRSCGCTWPAPTPASTSTASWSCSPSRTAAAGTRR